MIKNNEIYVNTLKAVLKKSNYAFWIKNLRGISDYLDPWFDYESMLHAINTHMTKHKEVFRLFLLATAEDSLIIASTIGEDKYRILIDGGLLIEDMGTVRTADYQILCYQGLYLLVDINAWYPTCKTSETNVYIGYDSLRLADNIAFDKGCRVLDLCSGSGIQGLLAARSAEHVVSVEINEKAIGITDFNIKLNGLSNIVELICGDLYSPVDGSKFDYIYANPPFIPMVDDVEYPICGRGGEDGLSVLRRIVSGIPEHLSEGGTAIIFCQCLGSSKSIFFLDELEMLAKLHGLEVTCFVTDKIIINYQADTLAELTALFNTNNNFSDTAFENRMKEIYRQLGAECLYSLVICIRIGGGENNFKTVKLVSSWNTNDSAIVLDNILVQPDLQSYIITRGAERIGFMDEEGKDILTLIMTGKTISQITDELFPKYSSRKQYLRFGKSQFEMQVLRTFEKFGKLGVIKPAHEISHD